MAIVPSLVVLNPYSFRVRSKRQEAEEGKKSADSRSSILTPDSWLLSPLS
jgi:hypothetical protein